MRRIIARGFALASALGLTVAYGQQGLSEVSKETKARAMESFKAQKNGFVENKGQWPSKVKFQARTPGLDVWVTESGWVFDQFSIQKGSSDSKIKKVGRAVSADFVGSHGTKGWQKLNPLPGTTSYLFEKRKASGIHSYNSIFASDLYKGIDLRNYFDGANVRHDLIVRPGAKPSAIKLKFNGAPISVLKSGEVQVGGKEAGFKLKGLYAYQQINGKQQKVDAAYVANGSLLSVKVGAYDASKPLVIDPVSVTYGSYYGGDDDSTEVKGVYADRDGSVYLTGRTLCTDFPAINSYYGLNLQGGYDAFISRLQGDVFVHDFSALFGSADDDEGDFLQRDAAGNIWVAGLTANESFLGTTQRPVTFALKLIDTNGNPTGGTFRLTVAGNAFDFAHDVDAATVESAINGLLGSGTVTCSGGPLPRSTIFLTFRVGFDPTVAVNDTRLHSDFEIVTDKSVQTLLMLGATAPTGGRVRIQFVTNAGTFVTNVDYPLDQPTINGNLGSALSGIGVSSLAGFANTSKLTPAGQEVFVLDDTVVGTVTSATVIGNTTGVPMTMVSGSQLRVKTDRPDATSGYLKFQSVGGTTPGFNVQSSTLGGVIGGMNSAYQAVTGATTANYFGVFDDNAVWGNFDRHRIKMEGVATAPSCYNELVYSRPFLRVIKQKNLFVMRWKKDVNKVLDPEVGSEKVRTFGFTVTPFVPNFKIILNSSTRTTDPVKIGLGGNTWSACPELDNIFRPWNQENGFVLRTDFDPNGGTFTDNASSHYIGQESTDGIRLTGVDFDSEGNQYVAGTVFITGNVDTSVNPVWTTTASTWQDARLSRNDDVFVRKYNSDGTLRWSGLLGGNGNDSTYGPEVDIDHEPTTNGSSIAVDTNNDVYVTGTARSFNFTRTRNVFGVNFPSFPIGFLTKITSDGASLGYSTSLNNPSAFRASGVVVDQVGNAWVHGLVRDVPYICVDGSFCMIDHTDDNAFTPYPALPPRNLNPAFVPTTADALGARVQTQPWGSPQGYLLCVNANADTLIFGSYIGQGLGTMLYKPFVDSFGDLWFNGRDTGRYITSFETPAATVGTTWDQSSTAFPWITPTAFKRYIPTGGSTFRQHVAQWANVHYQASNSRQQTYYDTMVKTTQYDPVVWSFQQSVSDQEAGFIGRLRYRFPAIAALQVATKIQPGANTGTIVMNQAIPGSGITVDLSTSDVNVITIDPNVFLPGPATNGNFNFTAAQVQVPTPVDITVNYANSIQTVRTVVTPVLESISANPDNFAGGTSQTGNVKLAFPQGPGQSVTVSLSTDRPDLVTFPNGANLTIAGVNGSPAIDNAAFTYATKGVLVPTPVNISANYQNATRTVKVTLLPAGLIGINFNPATVNGGAKVTATLKFDGKATAGIPMNVDISIPGLTAGTDYPASVVYDSTKPANLTFDITSRVLDVSRTYVVTATRRADANYTAQTVSGTFATEPNQLLDMTLEKTEVKSGSTLNGALQVASPAKPTGTPVTVTSSDPNVKIVGVTTAQNATVNVAGSSTNQAFTIETNAVSTDRTVTITATRGSVTITRTFLLKSATLSLDIDKDAVAAGQTATGTITLDTNAPTGGITFNVTSSSTAAVVPATVTIPAGSNTATFTVTTKFVAVTERVTITVQSGSVSSSDSFNLLGQGVSISFNPASVTGGTDAQATVTLTDPASDNLTLNLTSANESGSGVVAATAVSSTVTVLKGQTSANFSVNTIAVSQDTPVVFKALSGVNVLAQGNLVVKAPGIASLRFAPPQVKGGKSTVCTITLSADPPAGGLAVSLSNNNPQLVRLPSSGVVIPFGSRTYSFKVLTRRVSRTLSDKVTAVIGSSTASGNITVLR